MAGAAYVDAALVVPDAAESLVDVDAAEAYAPAEVVEGEEEGVLAVVVGGASDLEGLKPAENSDTALPVTDPST